MPGPRSDGSSHGEGGALASQRLAGDHATGEWGGARKRLDDHGVEPFGFWTGIGSGNPVGGRRKGFTPVDDWFFGLGLDLGKLGLLNGTKLKISGINRDGRGLTEHYVGSQFDVQQTVGGQTLFFYQLVLEQRLFRDHVTVKLGRFGASDEFNASPLYGNYLNNGIDGDVRNILFNTQFSAYPFATWAAMMRVDPDSRFYLQAGVFQAWDRIFDPTHHGLDWRIRHGDGVVLMAQAGWTPQFGPGPRPPGALKPQPDGKGEIWGRPGHYWVGATYSPWRGFPQFGREEKVGGVYGFYAHADQLVYQKKPGTDQGLTLWAATGVSPQSNVAIMPFQINVGLVYRGLFPSREQDRTVLGVIYGRFSREHAQTVQARGDGYPIYEAVIEGGHRFQLAPFAFVQPDVQWVIRPAGTGRIPNAVVVGAEVGLVF